MITYDLIQTTTLSTSASAVVFSSIPATFTDLVISSRAFTSTNTQVDLQFNGDTSTNYNYGVWDVPATGTASAPNVRSATAIQINAWSVNTGNTDNPSVANVNIFDYANATTYKTLLTRSFSTNIAGNSCIDVFTGTWRSTAAVTSISLASTFVAGTVISLYGIKAA